jgi:Na+/proline symporter
MTATLVVTLVGIVLITVLGFAGRRSTGDLAEWTVAGRGFGAMTMWFLQAGEVFTTFTFLGMAGLAFTGGAAALYALPYVPLAYAGLYFLGPVIWRRARDRGHLTQADFLADHYDSRLFGRLAALCGVVFLIPYLQLQITGLGLAVQLATGDKTSSDVSITIAFVLVVAFVLWAGIRGVATTSYFKDALMLVVLLVLLIAIPAHFAGGIGPTFDKILAGLIVGMSTLIARNLVGTRSERSQIAVNQVSVVVVTGFALITALVRPDLLANLLLLTYSGLNQLIPAIVLALFARKIVGLWPVLAGLLVGEAVVIWLTFSDVYQGHVNVGLIGLVPNVVVVAVGAVLERALGGRPAGLSHEVAGRA